MPDEPIAEHTAFEAGSNLQPADVSTEPWQTRARCQRCGWSTPCSDRAPLAELRCHCGGELERLAPWVPKGPA